MAYRVHFSKKAARRMEKHAKDRNLENQSGMINDEHRRLLFIINETVLGRGYYVAGSLERANKAAKYVKETFGGRTRIEHG